MKNVNVPALKFQKKSSALLKVSAWEKNLTSSAGIATVTIEAREWLNVIKEADLTNFQVI